MTHRQNLITSLIEEFSRLKHRLIKSMDSLMPALTLSQKEVLFTVMHHKGTGVGELAKIMNLTPGAITQQLDSLEKTGLVMRTASPDDRRAVLVQLSPEGDKLMRKLEKARTHALAESLENFTDQEIADFVTMIKKMNE